MRIFLSPCHVMESNGLSDYADSTSTIISVLNSKGIGILDLCRCRPSSLYSSFNIVWFKACNTFKQVKSYCENIRVTVCQSEIKRWASFRKCGGVRVIADQIYTIWSSMQRVENIPAVRCLYNAWWLCCKDLLALHKQVDCWVDWAKRSSWVFGVLAFWEEPHPLSIIWISIVYDTINSIYNRDRCATVARIASDDNVATTFVI